MFQAEVIATRPISPRVRELTLDPGDHFEFLPGQWVSIQFPLEDRRGLPLKRSYSIASAPRPDGRFELAVTRVDSGPGSGYLHEVGDGAVLSISRAQGMFELPELVRPLLLVAAGTGVAPFRAMLQTLQQPAADPVVPVTLLFGARTAADLLYREELDRLVTELPGFRFEPTLSRPDADWTGRRGRVQVHLPGLVAEHQGGCDLMVCGVGEMVKEVRALAREELGLARDRVRTERFN